MKSRKFLLPILAVLTIALVCVFVLPQQAQAATEWYYLYEYGSDNSFQVIISGCSDSLSGDITIPETINGYPVVGIRQEAFKDCTNLTSVTIPEGVTSIGPWAFAFCENLTSVTIPDSVTVIENNAFYKCNSLTTVTIPGNVTEIDSEVFKACQNLTSVKIGEGVTSIDRDVFRDCYNLTWVTIPGSVTSIGEYAFYNCSKLSNIDITDVTAWCNISFVNYCANPLRANSNAKKLYLNGELITDLVIPDSVTGIGKYAFYSCENLTSVMVGSGVTAIGEYAFYECTSLKTVAIADGVTSIDNCAFHSCAGLISVTMGKNVTRIGDEAFYNCNRLTSITLWDSVTSIGSYAFFNCVCLTDIVIPNSVTSIQYGAFEKCIRLSSVTIPAAVTSIGDCVFYGCTKLTGIWVDENNPNYCNDDKGVLFNKTKTKLIQAPGAISGNYVIPDSVTNIENNAFENCTKLTSVTMPNSVTGMGWYIFYNCTALESVVISDKITWITQYMFSNCTSLTSVTIPDGAAKIDYSAFENCASLTSITIPDSMTAIYSEAFNSCNKLANVYYSGSYGQWRAIDIYDTNEDLKSAIIHYDHTHDYTVFPAEILKEATCVEAGIKQYTCIHGETYTETIPTLGHNIVEVPAKASTCTEEGSTAGSWCDRCREFFVTPETIPALGHSYSKGTCTNCGDTPAAVKITTQPVDVSLAIGKTASVTVEATGTGLKYTWYYKNAGTTGFAKSSTTGSTYSMKLSSSNSGRQVYCRVTDQYGNTVQSKAVYLRASAAITTQPAGKSVAVNQTVSTTVKATGLGLKYTWYYKDTTMKSFAKSSVTTATYSTTMNTARSGRQVYCKVTDKYGYSATTNTVTLKAKVSITTQPTSKSVAINKTVSTTVKATGVGLKYTWYYKDTGASGFTKSSTTSATYSTTMTSARSGRQVYCVVKDQYGNSVKSNTVTLKAKVSITTQPVSKTVAKNQTASVTVKATGVGLKYTWYYKDTTMKSFTKSSTTSATYSTTMTSARNGRQLYCVVTDKYGNTVKTVTVTLKMK